METNAVPIITYRPRGDAAHFDGVEVAYQDAQFAVVARMSDESIAAIAEAVGERQKMANEIRQLRGWLEDIIDGVEWNDCPFDEKAYRARDAFRGRA